MEAGCVTGCKELLGVVALTGAAHFLGDSQVSFEATIGGAHVPVAPFARGEGFGGVENF